MNRYRVIVTPYSSNKAYEIFMSIHAQLAANKKYSIWKNAAYNNMYWTNFEVVRGQNGHICFYINDDKMCNDQAYRGLNPFAHMSDDMFLFWIAKKLKEIIILEIKNKQIDINDIITLKQCVVSDALSYREKVTLSDICELYAYLKTQDINYAKLF